MTTHGDTRDGLHMANMTGTRARVKAEGPAYALIAGVPIMLIDRGNPLELK